MYTHESNTRDTDSNAWESVSLRPVEKLGWGKEESRHRDRDMVSMENEPWSGQRGAWERQGRKLWEGEEELGLGGPRSHQA